MKQLLTILFALLLISGYSQSELYFMDGSKKTINIKSKKRDYVIYSDTGDYQLNIAYANQIMMLRIEDGTFLMYNGEPLKEDNSIDNSNTFSPIMGGVSWFSPVQGVWTFWGQYIHGDGMFGGRLYYTHGMDSDFSNERGLIWSSGVDGMVFPFGHSRWSYFTGVGIRFGEEKNVTKVQCFVEPCSGDIVDIDPYRGIYGLSGVLYTPFKYFAMSGSIGIGYRSTAGNVVNVGMIAELSMAFRLYP